MTQANITENSTTLSETPLEGNYFVSAYPPFSCWQKDSTTDVEKLLKGSTHSQEELPLGLYVHIPFCTVRCLYCYYLSYAKKSDDLINHYIESLLQEVKLYGDFENIAKRSVNFAYFGGGTPSILSVSQITRLLEGIQRVFPWSAIEEVTFECSPTTIIPEKLIALKDAGVTRLSMGVQQFNDEVLRQNGRVHLVKDVERAYEMITKVGFDVVNLDLIVGLVGETNTTFMDSLDQMIGMNPDSVTIYQLEIPQNTPLYHLYHNEKLETSPAPWDVKRTRLAKGFSMLERAGYRLRSAYTAARTPKSQNFIYQDAQYHGVDLVGIGASAFSYFDGCHYQNLTSVSAYLEQTNKNRLPIERAYFLSDQERLVRELILQLKLGSLDRQYFVNKFDVDVFERFTETIADFEREGLIFKNGEQLNLTRQGLLRVDQMLSTFYLPEHQEVRYS